MGTETIAVAISGGVDSSVAAGLLVAQGLRVVGLHMLLHGGDCPEGLRRAREAADRLAVPLRVVDLRPEFRRLVLEPFAAAYRAGRTPNPCLSCNPAIKFGSLLERARQLCGARLLATGHYARLAAAEDGPAALLRGADRAKDQSYFLALVPRETLAQVRLPLGGLSKAEVRRLAERWRLWRELPEDSQEVCFLEGADYRGLVADTECAGQIVDLEGNVLGQHRGIWRYTVGQRRGLGVCGPEALYVRALDPATNRVIVARAGQAPFTWMVVSGLNWLSAPQGLLRCGVRTRYRQPEQGCRATAAEGGRLRVVFDAPQRAISPGQGAVFYEGERVLAGGIIEAAG